MKQLQERTNGVAQEPKDAPTQSLLDKARARATKEKDLSTSTQTVHYAPASLGQTPYVALPGVGTVVYRRCGWGC